MNRSCNDARERHNEPHYAQQCIAETRTYTTLTVMPSVKTVFFYILIAIVVLMIAPLAYKYWSDSADTPVEPIVLTGGEIAERMVQFIAEKAQRPDGSFYSAFECSMQGSPCVPLSSPGATRAGYAIAALYAAGLKDNADKGMQFSLGQCKNESTCDFNALDLYYRESKDERYRKALEIAGKDALNKAASARTVEDHVELTLNNIPEKLARMYELTGDVRYRDALKKMGDDVLRQVDFAKASEMYAMGQYDLYSNTAILASKALTRVFRATGDTRYSNAYKVFFDKSQIVQRADELLLAPHRLYAPQIASVEGLVYLSTVETDPAAAAQYKEDARLILHAILARKFDSAERPIWDGGNNLVVRPRYIPAQPEGQAPIRYKGTNENGLMAFLLIMHFSDTKFTLTQ